MTKRERIIAVVASYVAEAGYCDGRCTRAYVDGRIGHAAWREAKRRGLAAHKPKTA